MWLVECIVARVRWEARKAAASAAAETHRPGVHAKLDLESRDQKDSLPRPLSVKKGLSGSCRFRDTTVYVLSKPN